MTTTELTTVAQQVRQALAAPCGFKPEDIRPEHTLAGDLRMDSLDMLEAVMRVEEACHVELPDHEVEQVSTVADLIALVERKRGAA